uniref:Uncharacterized protein LOC108051033 n=1 Tax=Drosophila rhopaloa TaxID=1041015 RepID=A0A6P4FLY5_DRORH
MDENGEFFLDHYSLLEIMKYVISNRKLKEPRKEKIDDDLISFVLAHEFFLQLFESHHKLLYEDLQLDLACRITKLLIDLRVNGSSNENEFFWRSHLQYIREKRNFNVELYFGHQKHVIIKTKEISTDLTITEDLMISVNVTGKELIDICTSIPNLRMLHLDSSEIHGSLPHTIPHCENLEELRITLSSGGCAAQFASLAKLPNLKTFVISGIQASGSQVQFCNDLRKWHRPTNLQPLTLIIEDFISGKSQSITFGISESLRHFKIHQSYKFSQE